MPFENHIPSTHWTFFDTAPRFAAKTKLALCAQTVVFACATLRGQGPRKISNARFRNMISKRHERHQGKGNAQRSIRIID
jgi:hypothetical protein